MSAAVSRVSDPDSEHLSPDVPYQGQPDVIRQTGHLFVEWGGAGLLFGNTLTCIERQLIACQGKTQDLPHDPTLIKLATSHSGFHPL